MEQNAIAQPRVSSGKNYSYLYQLYLHVVAAILRKAVSQLTGVELLRQRKITIDTPSLGGGSVTVSVWTPERTDDTRKPCPLVVVLEGGGFILGQPKDGQNNCSRISDETGSIVISVEYAKAPRYPYPHALLQIQRVVQWSFSTAAKNEGLNIDPSRVAVMGNSAGGNLTASLSLLLSFHEGPCAEYRKVLPSTFNQSLQILLYPSLELYNTYGARYRRASPEVQTKSLPVWAAELMEASYCPPYVDKTEIFISPLMTDDKLMKSLKIPPALVLAAGMDCLNEEAIKYIQKLKAVDVDVQAKNYPLAVHGFSHITETSAQKEDYRPDDVEDCWSVIIESLRQAFLDTQYT